MGLIDSTLVVLFFFSLSVSVRENELISFVCPFKEAQVTAGRLSPEMMSCLLSVLFICLFFLSHHHHRLWKNWKEKKNLAVIMSWLGETDSLSLDDNDCVLPSLRNCDKRKHEFNRASERERREDWQTAGLSLSHRGFFLERKRGHEMRMKSYEVRKEKNRIMQREDTTEDNWELRKELTVHWKECMREGSLLSGKKSSGTWGPHLFYIPLSLPHSILFSLFHTINLMFKSRPYGQEHRTQVTEWNQNAKKKRGRSLQLHPVLRIAVCSSM